MASPTNMLEEMPIIAVHEFYKRRGPPTRTLERRIVTRSPRRALPHCAHTVT